MRELVRGIKFQNTTQFVTDNVIANCSRSCIPTESRVITVVLSSFLSINTPDSWKLDFHTTYHFLIDVTRGGGVRH